VETLHEIDIAHRAQAIGLGIREYRMAPGLNDAPRFIGALGRLARACLTHPAVVAARL